MKLTVKTKKGEVYDIEDGNITITNMPKQSWEEEFDEKFPNLYDGCDGREGYDANVKNYVIDFIKSLLSQREAEIRKETILAVLPYQQKHTKGKEQYEKGWDGCIEEIENNAKSLYNINLE